MARCAYCKAETILYDHGVPICLECSDEREVKHKRLEIERQVNIILIRDVKEATERTHAASDAFEAIVADVPSGLPHPDGTQRIHNASRKLSTARQEMMRAHERLHDFLSHGIIPEDLKQGSGGNGVTD
jgi:hypothetical protein